MCAVLYIAFMLPSSLNSLVYWGDDHDMTSENQHNDCNCLPIHVMMNPVVLTSEIEHHPYVIFYPCAGLMSYGGEVYCHYSRQPSKAPWHMIYPSMPFEKVLAATKSVALAHRSSDDDEGMAPPWHPIFAGYRQPRQLCVFLTSCGSLTVEDFDSDCDDSTSDEDDGEHNLFGLWMSYERRFGALQSICCIQKNVRTWLSRARKHDNI